MGYQKSLASITIARDLFVTFVITLVIASELISISMHSLYLHFFNAQIECSPEDSSLSPCTGSHRYVCI